jgi:zinc protease
MAVVAVGDVDPARMDSLIHARFGGLARPARPSLQQAPDIPIHTETLIAIATDKEATGSSVGILYKRPHRAERTVADFRRDLVEQLYAGMLNARLSEIAHRADPPFLSASTGSGQLGRALDIWRLNATVADGGIGRGLAALLEEAARVRQHGFLASELQRAKEQRRKWAESAYAERERSESDGFAGLYVETYLTGEPEPGIEVTTALIRALLDGITLDEVNALTAGLMGDSGRVVLANAPERGGLAAPTEAELRAMLARSATIPVAAWEDRTAGRSLMPEPPKPGRIASRRSIDALGVTVLTLSNGVEVWLKPTDFKADEVLIGGYANGGMSAADSAAYVTALLAAPIVIDGGVGGFTGVELRKLLADKIASAVPYAGPYTHGVSAQARPADLETALQLIHLDFTRPTVDSTGFAALRQRMIARLADRANSPEQVFGDTLTMVNTGGFYMFRAPTAAGVAGVKLGDALEVYRRRYLNAADFTFFVVGAFQVDSLAPLLAEYLGSLPSSGRRTSHWVPIGPRYPDGVRTLRVRKGVEPKAQVVITFFTNGGLEELDLFRARAGASILMDRLRQSLRELLGSTYSPAAGFSFTSPVPGYQTMAISFGCDPARVDTLVGVALAEVRRLREAGPSPADVEKEQETERRELEVALKQNGFWLGALQTVHQLGWDPLRLLERRRRIDQLDPASLKATFARYTPLDRYTVVALVPESPGAGADR